MIEDTIIALSTPVGKSGIGVVRMSGKESLNIAKKMFTPLNKNIDIIPNLMLLGNIDLGSTKDLGFFVYFKAPKSYTGEDIVEFQCHGGIAVTQKIIEKALSLGVRLAEPGEFSKRAFLNGKMTLDQAEGVIDTINAESESELKASSSLQKGILTKTILDIQEKLIDVMSEIEVNLDYPEHDIEYATKEKINEEIDKIYKKICALLNTEQQGKIIKNGVNIAIVGKTNVGKSSLLNSLLGTEQAIVTDIEGTTRDIVIGSIEYNGVKFNFLDTAGIRTTNDKVESIGIEKAKQAINESDIVILVLDGSKELDEQDKQNLELTKNKKRIIVTNKIDLKNIVKLEEETIQISAKNNINIDKLKDKIFEKAIDGGNVSNTLILTNVRHIEVLKKAKKDIENIKETIFDNSLDLVSLDIRQLYECLGEITGETIDEKVIDQIFSKFCLGK